MVSSRSDVRGDCSNTVSLRNRRTRFVKTLPVPTLALAPMSKLAVARAKSMETGTSVRVQQRALVRNIVFAVCYCWFVVPYWFLAGLLTYCLMCVFVLAYFAVLLLYVFMLFWALVRKMAFSADTGRSPGMRRFTLDDLSATKWGWVATERPKRLQETKAPLTAWRPHCLESTASPSRNRRRPWPNHPFSRPVRRRYFEGVVSVLLHVRVWRGDGDEDGVLGNAPPRVSGEAANNDIIIISSSIIIIIISIMIIICIMLFLLLLLVLLLVLSLALSLLLYMYVCMCICVCIYIYIYARINN